MNLSVLRIVLFITVALSATGCRSSTSSENAHKGSSESNSNAAPASGTGAQVERFRVDASRSQFTARVGVGGLLSALGHEHVVAIRDFTGEAQVTPSTLEPGSLQLTINARSLAETEREFSDSDRQKIDQAVRDEALEIAKYPQIVFKSTRISSNKTGDGQYEVQIDGELTLHGVTRPVTVPAQVSFDGNGLTARGHFTVRHSDYQMKRISAGGGTVTAKDEIALSFNVIGVKS
jgi:polyisoprenoid-binding protein YceI